MKHLIILLLMVMAANSAQAEDIASILNPSGLPIPRHVSLKYDEINVRVGPGKRYPIHHVYHRKNLPVQVIEEFAHWRKIKDFRGNTGWVHKGAIDGKRTAMIIDKPQNLYAKPQVTDRPVMRAAATVIGTLNTCLPDWCEMTIKERDGWIRKSDIWGVTREEVFEK